MISPPRPIRYSFLLVEHHENVAATYVCEPLLYLMEKIDRFDDSSEAPQVRCKPGMRGSATLHQVE